MGDSDRGPYAETARGIEAAEIFSRGSATNDNGGPSNQLSKAAQVAMLTNFVDELELFHDGENEPFADIDVFGHRETMRVREERFRHWLAFRYYGQTNGAPTPESLRSAVDLTAARARFGSPKRTFFVRHAEHKGKIYIDLCDEDWRALEVDADSWQIIGQPPVRFRRPVG